MIFPPKYTDDLTKATNSKRIRAVSGTIYFRKTRRRPNRDMSILKKKKKNQEITSKPP